MPARIAIQHLCLAAIQAALFLALLWAPSAANAQQATTNPKPAPPAAATPAKPPASTEAANKAAGDQEKKAQPAKAPGEGIQIHGHWVIDVRNPDGKLVEHRDFENSLVTNGSLVSGDQLLAGLLTGNMSVGDPAIGFVQGKPGSDPSTYCNASPPPGVNTTCYGLTTEADYLTRNVPNFVTGLNSSYTFGAAVNWTLTGAYTIPATLSSISAVQTLVSICTSSSSPFFGSSPSQFQGGPWATGRSGGNIPPSICNVQVSGNNADIVYGTFTSANLSPALSVSTGQVITATVVFSFS